MITELGRQIILYTHAQLNLLVHTHQMTVNCTLQHFGTMGQVCLTVPMGLAGICVFLIER